MPKLPPRFTNCAVYIYGSVQDANDGEGGACGFVVMFRSRYEGRWFPHHYVVTNAHVIERAGSTPTLRINISDGKTEILRTSQDDWVAHPDGDDLSVFPISLHASHKIIPVAVEDFVSQDKLPFWIGIGTETLMVGRFMSHDGKQRNTPAVRYGNIAMMPEEPIELPSGIKQECFLVEMRSIPGASGSAVFALYSLVQFFEHSPFGTPKVEPPRNWVMLLGVDFCHLNTQERVRASDGSPTPEKYFVRSNAGMAGVIPAWRLRRLLEESEKLVKTRAENDKKYKQEYDARDKLTPDSSDDGKR
jgi:hypothetical protein